MYPVCPKNCGFLIIKPICGSSPKCCHNLGSTKLSQKSLNTVALQLIIIINNINNVPQCNIAKTTNISKL